MLKRQLRTRLTCTSRMTLSLFTGSWAMLIMRSIGSRPSSIRATRTPNDHMSDRRPHNLLIPPRTSGAL
jgi:DNA-binding HxlR family transcriptional regulator